MSLSSGTEERQALMEEMQCASQETSEMRDKNTTLEKEKEILEHKAAKMVSALSTINKMTQMIISKCQIVQMK